MAGRVAVVVASAVLLVAGTTSVASGTISGQLYAFGDNYYGQLGNATDNGFYTANPTPTLVSLPGATGPVTKIAAGAEHSLAVTSTGQLYAWGNNEFGQLGSATNVSDPNAANPTPTLVYLPGATGPVTQVAAGAEHSLAVTSTGQLYAFGYNYWGQLGNATDNQATSANPTPTLVSLPGATGPVTQIAAGADHSLAITSTGQLYAFGTNSDGELGNATNNGTGNANPTPTLVSLPGATGPVTQIVAGAEHSLAITSTGQLYAFGNNFFGQLGNTTNYSNGFDINAANPTPTLVGLPGATGPVAQIAAGTAHSLAMTSTGQLYAFGDNTWGQLGSACCLVMTATPTPLRVALPAGLIALAVGPEDAADYTLVVLAPAEPPILSAFRTSPGKFSLAGRLARGRCVKPSDNNRKHKLCRRPIALKLSYTLNTAATVNFTLTLLAPGRKRHGRCLKVTTKNRLHARCTRSIAVPGSVTHTSSVGSNTFTFDGRIDGKTLAPGSYRVTATPTSNGRRGMPESATFKLVH